MSKKSALAILMLVSLFITACGIGVPRTQTPEEIATIVAATVAALSPTETPVVSETAPAPATEEPTEAVPLTLKVVYVDGFRNLWAWSEGSLPRQLTSSADVVSGKISPDGSQIVFIRSADFTNQDIFAINFDGTNERILLSAADLGALPSIDPSALTLGINQLEWIPGSSQLALSTRLVYDGPGLLLNRDLWIIDTASGTRTNRIPAGSGGMFFYSPDGSQIAITTPTNLSIMNADGSNVRLNVLTYPFINTASEYAWHAMPQWAADSSRMRVVIPPAEPFGSPLAPTAIWDIPVSGAPVEKFWEFTATFMSPELSPDLQRALYLKPTVDPNINELHLYNLDGSGDTAIATGQFNPRGWSPDSTRYALAQFTPDAAYFGQVGAGISAIPGVGSMLATKWVDGDRLVLFSNSPAGWDLKLVSTSGTSTTIASLATGPSYFLPNMDAGMH
ncbi:MAG: hypothetical protein HGA86_02605 [Anaerolineaceae bacterium]|nr:hypothetical protein [Anaerolineaceae bacterium]